MFLSKEFVLKRVNAALKRAQVKVRADLKQARRELTQNPESTWTAKRVKSLERQLSGYGALDGIPFKPRKGTFEGATSYGGGWYRERSSVGTVSCGLDIETGRAHSYEWYDLGKIINGVYVVNSFYYSSETRGHYFQLMRTLKILGVKFVELEAPKGLQDLDAALEYQLNRIGEATIALEFGNKKARNSSWRRRIIREATKQLEMLAKFGVKSNQKMIQNAIDAARKSRDSRLEYAKQDRERAFQREYERALRDQDLKKIVQLTAKNQRRVDRGLPSLIQAA